MSDPLIATHNRQENSANFSFDFGAGLRFQLDERLSSRRVVDCELRVPLTGNNPPDDLNKVVLKAETPQGTVEESFSPETNLVWEYPWNGVNAAGQHHIGSAVIPVAVGWQRSRKGPLPPRTQWWDKSVIRAGWDTRTLPFGGLLPLGFWHLEPEAAVLWGAAGHRVQNVEIFTGDDRASHGLSWVPAWSNDLIVLTNSQVQVFSQTGQLRLSLDRANGEELFRPHYDDQEQLIGWSVSDNPKFQVYRENDSTVVTAPNGHHVTFHLDENRRLTRAITATNAIFISRINPFGLVKEITDPAGLTIGVTHDEADRATTLSWSTGQREDFVALSEANRQNYRVITASGREASESTRSLPGKTTETRTRCCGSGVDTVRLQSTGQTRVTQADGTVLHRAKTTVSTKDGEQQNERITLRTPQGRTAVIVRQRHVSSNGDVEEVLEQGGQRWLRSINRSNSTVTEIRPSGFTTRADYSSPNLRRWHRPDLGVTETEFVDGRVTRISRGGSKTIADYDEAGWLKTVAEDGVVKQFNYNQAGHVIAEYTGIGWLQFERDAAGRMVSYTTPRGDTTRIGLAPDGVVESIARPTENGTLTENFFYDRDRNLIRRQVDGEEPMVISRSVSGQVAQMISGDSTIDFGFDERSGRVVSASTEAGNSMVRTYDGYLLVAQESKGHVAGLTEFDFDSNHQLSSTTVAGMALPIERDIDGEVTTRGPVRFVRSPETSQVTSTLVGALTTNYSYDEQGEIVGQATYFGEQLIFGENISRDETGLIVLVEETTAYGVTTISYSYDQARRLSSVSENGSALVSLTYDSNDNIISFGRTGGVNQVEVGVGDRIQSVDGQNTGGYSPSGRVETLAGRGFSYDGFGRVIKVTTSEGQTASYVRDANHQIIEIAIDGQIVFQFLRKPGGVAAVIKADGTIWRVVEDERTEAPTVLVNENQTVRLLCDHRGNVRMAVDAATGEVVQALTYGPLGEMATDTKPGFQPFGYAGAIQDHVAGLVHLGARELDVITSRFLQPDPLGLGGEQTNLYAYAANDPVNRNDPDGLQSSSTGSVSVCKVQIKTADRSTWDSTDHAYLKWGDTRRGMGRSDAPPEEYTGLPRTEWKNEDKVDKKRANEQCREVEDVDVECLDAYTTEGHQTGVYHPLNVCWDSVYEALDTCSDGKWRWKNPLDPTWPISTAREVSTLGPRKVRTFGEQAAKVWLWLTE